MLSKEAKSLQERAISGANLRKKSIDRVVLDGHNLILKVDKVLEIDGRQRPGDKVGGERGYIMAILSHLLFNYLFIFMREHLSF